MPTTVSHANDAMIRRLEEELEERNTYAQGIIRNAQDGERDLNETETEALAEARNRMSQLRGQLETLESTADMAKQVKTRARELDEAISTARRVGGEKVEYRSAGAYLMDVVAAKTGSRDAMERLELFERVADHQKTEDNPGIVPDPIVGEVINFIDAARPIVGFLMPRNMPSATWHRPRVTQNTTVGLQGATGSAAEEKTELDSQAMSIVRLTANARTFGGYVNVSRQNIDFSSPQALDMVINDLAAQYAIQTEAATAADIATTGTTAVNYPMTDPTNDDIAGAVWEAAAQVYTAVKGQGRLALVVAPDVLSVFGRLFPPVNPRDAQSPGFEAGRFAQGQVGNVSGIPTIMSAGLGSGEAFVLSSAAIEVFEQRVGSLQATEPSVLGVQVAYAGYFTPLLIEDGGIVPLEASA